MLVVLFHAHCICICLCTVQDVSGVIQGDSHGEVLAQISDFVLFTVSGHNGDPNIQFVNVLANRADLYHTGKFFLLTRE